MLRRLAGGPRGPIERRLLSVALFGAWRADHIVVAARPRQGRSAEKGVVVLSGTRAAEPWPMPWAISVNQQLGARARQNLPQKLELAD